MSEKKIFEYFKVDEMFFVGKHREFVDKLWTQNMIQESFFRRLVDLYCIAAAVGLRIGRKSPEENDDTGLKRTVQLKQISECYQTLSTIMKMILVFDDSRGIPLEERIESAFRIPEDYDEYSRNMNLFNSYARGGVEYLYEQLVLKAPDIDDDYSDSRVSNIIALLKNPLEKDELV